MPDTTWPWGERERERGGKGTGGKQKGEGGDRGQSSAPLTLAVHTCAGISLCLLSFAAAQKSVPKDDAHGDA